MLASSWQAPVLEPAGVLNTQPALGDRTMKLELKLWCLAVTDWSRGAGCYLAGGVMETQALCCLRALKFASKTICFCVKTLSFGSVSFFFPLSPLQCPC